MGWIDVKGYGFYEIKSNSKYGEKIIALYNNSRYSKRTKISDCGYDKDSLIMASYKISRLLKSCMLGYNENIIKHNKNTFIYAFTCNYNNFKYLIICSNRYARKAIKLN